MVSLRYSSAKPVDKEPTLGWDMKKLINSKKNKKTPTKKQKQKQRKNKKNKKQQQQKNWAIFFSEALDF